MIANYPVIIAASSISTFFPFLASTFLYKRLRFERILLLWFLFFALAAMTEIILNIFSLQSSPSAWIFHIYTIFEFVLVAMIISYWQSTSRGAKLVRISIPIYIFIFFFLKAIGLESFETGLYNNITRPLAVLILGAFALFTLQNLWRHTPANLSKNYRFWMLLAMVLYYSTSLGLFALMYTKNQELLVLLFKFHAVVNILHNILFTIGVLRVRGQKGIDIQTTQASDYSLS